MMDNALAASDESPAPHGQWIFRSKLLPPLQDLSLINRKPLLDLVDQASRSTLCVIAAPAGFGKTSLLAQWRQYSLDRKDVVAWLTLDESDSEPHQFLAYVIAALTAAGIRLESLSGTLSQGTTRSELEPTVYAMLDIIAAQGSKTAIILDDYHRAEADETNRLLVRIITDAPSNLSVVVNTRTSPGLNFAQLIASGRATEIDAEQLRFTEAETGATLGHCLTEDRLRELHERTGGWPVVVQLARVLMADGDCGSLPLDRFAGNAGHVASYLSGEVLSGLEPDLRDFLIRTSHLERFNVELADAVTGCRNGADCMLRLAPLRALIVPLADTAGWFRYHHLFAECLFDYLNRSFPEQLSELHARASLWFAEQGQIVDAVRHARAAGDYDRCAALIAQAGGWRLITYGGIGYLRNLLQNLPSERLPDYPRMQLAKAYLEAKDGHIREARALLDAVDTSKEIGVDAALERDIVNVTSLIEDYEDPHVTVQSLKLLEEKIARVPAADALARGTLQCQRMLNLVALGHLTEAEVAAETMMRSMRQAGSVLGVNYCFLHMALIALYQGRFNAADTNIAIAGRMADANFGADSGLRSLADTLLGSLRLWQGRLGGEILERFRNAGEEVEANDGWLEIYANLLDCEAELNHVVAIARAERLVEARGLDRLHLQLLTQKLRDALREGRMLEAEGLARRLSRRLPDQVWRSDPFLWRPFIESRLILATMLGRRDRNGALNMLDDAHECCAKTGAHLFRIDIMVMRAELLHQAGDRASALAILSDALYLAVPERICRPFLRHTGIVPLLRTLRRTKSGNIDILVAEFITELLGQIREASYDDRYGLSHREHEVLDQLSRGLKNKEIARTLDMTEHTVKFHLKNIFAKLGVERRSDAVIKARVVAAA